MGLQVGSLYLTVYEGNSVYMNSDVKHLLWLLLVHVKVQETQNRVILIKSYEKHVKWSVLPFTLVEAASASLSSLGLYKTLTA